MRNHRRAPDCTPFRVDVDLLEVRAAPIRPLIGWLTFITDPRHRGAAFRYGQLRVSAGDFGLVACALGAAVTCDDLPPASPDRAASDMRPLSAGARSDHETGLHDPVRL